MNKKDIFVYFITLLMFGIFFYFTLNAFSYFDPSHLCYIALNKDSLRGNRQTIIDAIRKLKRGDEESYGELCKYVDRISENFCIANDFHLNPAWQEKAKGKNATSEDQKLSIRFLKKNILIT